MNCAECRDNLVGYIEGSLSEEESARYGTHLESCAGCRAEYQAYACLQQKLSDRGRAAAGVTVADPVMRRILLNHTKREREPIMTTIFRRWGLGLGAAAGMAIIALLVILTWPGGGAKAAEILEKGAKAASGITGIHMQCSLRTNPNDNFGAISPDQNFWPIEIWKQFGDNAKWRIDKPGRIAFMNGQSTVLYLKYDNVVNKFDKPSQSAFDTDWIHDVANVAQLLTSELGRVRMQGAVMQLTKETGANGATKSVVTVESKSKLPEGDYLKNKFFNDSDTRRVYVFDDQSNRLETARIYLLKQPEAKLIFEVKQIDYNPTIDEAVFNPKLPENVYMVQEGMKTLPDNQRYAAMTPEQTTRAFFEACGRGDWDEVAKYSPVPFGDPIKEALKGIQIVSIGQSFKSESYPGVFVPYEIKAKNGESQKSNLALKKDPNSNRWYFDGGL
jgi:outer membrane lipoprotein-sorting protein